VVVTGAGFCCAGAGLGALEAGAGLTGDCGETACAVLCVHAPTQRARRQAKNPRLQNRDLRPTDEDLSVGAPDLGHRARVG
jgi:hypothetical protein